ncbi:hypothetical protein AX769_21845 (plasmid) [Frondihabitans sp. PAMC 28766]|nr:hypothetical protein AX769_21845 [Frondihabitans sp. PAMC 28766]
MGALAASPRRNEIDLTRQTASERLARLEGDRNLVAALEERHFDGAHYIYFSTVLAQYGVAVLRAWIRDRKVHQKVREKGFGSLPPEPWSGALTDDPDTGEELALETVARALITFRDKVLVPGKWKPEGGASLKTFFVGQCLMQFGNVYRPWLTQMNNERPTLTVEDDMLDILATFVEGPEAAATQQDLVRRALGKIQDERVRTAFYLKAIHGYTYQEIAHKMGITDKALEGLITRARKEATGGGAA